MSDFFKALRFGNLDEVARFLESGTDPNAPDEHGITPLMRAAKYGFYDIALNLINHGANVDLSTEDGYTALFGASENYWPMVVKLLIQYSADVAVHDNGGWTPLHRAVLNLHTVAMNEKRDVVGQLLKSGANVNAATDSMDTPLHYAAELGDPEIVKLLLDFGADVNAHNRDGALPLNESANREVSDILQQHGAKISSEYEAVRTGDLGIVIDFLNKGGDPNKRNCFGDTPLHEAVLCNYLDIAETLLRFGSDPNIANNFDELVIDQTDNHEMADLLLRHGAKVEYIQTAVRIEDPDMVESFLKRGISPNKAAGGFKGMTILHDAAWYGYTEIVDLLLNWGADMERKDDITHRTPLFYAVTRGRDETVKYLIKKGADIEARNEFGFTPLISACYNGLNDTITLLLDLGANINALDCQGESPLRHAIEGIHGRGGANQATIAILRQRGGR